MMDFKHIFNKKMSLLILALLLCPFTTRAQDAVEFHLDPIVVTATRAEKKDLAVPAKVNVYTADELVKTGAANVVEALKYTEGIVYHSQGPAGQSIDVMTSKLVVRGQDRGTLVLLDGVPFNLSGIFSLENMPLEGIERIEVVKGVGSVLYGGDSTGGVINIIRKKEMDKTAFFSSGNFGRYDTGTSWQDGKLSISYQHSRMGSVEHFGENFTGPTSVYYNLKNSTKDMYSWRYSFDEHFSISQIYGRNRYQRTSELKTSGLITARNDYNAYQSMTTLHYENQGLKADLYDNWRKTYNQTVGSSILQSTAKERLSGLALQYAWQMKNSKLTVGMDIQREYSASRAVIVMPLIDYDRMNYALFAQWEKDLGEKWLLTLGARETWTGGAKNGKDYDNFSPQIQVLYKKDAYTSFYASAARTFVMPTLSQTYGLGSSRGNPDIRPQTGLQYEVGAKYNRGIHSWRLSAFSLDIENYIAAYHIPGGQPGDVYYTNEDRKNLGLELSYGLELKNGFSLKLGAVYSKPRYQTTDAYGIKSPWRDQYGHWQFNVGLDYEKGKWAVSMYGNYLTDRTIADSYATTHPAPLFLTGARLSYKPGVKHELYCNFDNLFDRRGITSNTATTSAFYQMGFTFQIGYKYKFD